MTSSLRSPFPGLLTGRIVGSRRRHDVAEQHGRWGHHGRRSLGDRQMDTGSPDRSDLRPTMDTVRCRCRCGARRHLGAAGVGLRGARWTSACDRLVHVHRMPGGLCGLWPVEDPRPWPGFFDLTSDFCRTRAPPRRRRRAPSDRSGGDAGGDRRHHRNRTGDRTTRFRRGPALERGAGWLYEWSRPHHYRRPIAQTLRLLDRRRGLWPGDQGIRARARWHRGGGTSGRVGGVGHLVGAVPVHQGRPCGPRRYRGCNRRLCDLRLACARGRDRRDASPRRADAFGPLDEVG